MTDIASPEPMAEVRALAPAPEPEPRKRISRRTGNRRRMTPAERQAKARQLWRDSNGTLTGDQLAEAFGMSPRWGRLQVAEAKAEDNTDGAAILPPAGAAATGGAPGAAEAEPVRTAAASPDAANGGNWAQRLAAIAVAVPLVVVLLAPVSMSFHSLADYAVEQLGLEHPWSYGFPLAVDTVALLCVALTFHAVLAGDGSAGPRLMLWALVGGSAVLNYRHGTTVSSDAGWVFAAMPVIAAVMLDLVLRRVRRGVLKALGVVEQPLARYRMARWLVAPRETFGAWTTSVRENVSSPVDSLALYRARKAEESGGR